MQWHVMCSFLHRAENLKTCGINAHKDNVGGKLKYEFGSYILQSVPLLIKVRIILHVCKIF
jgi:hypothetical protein